jgi:nitrite reductase (NO-forming)
VYGLSNPSDTVVFALHVVWLPVMLIACLAGLAATVQNYRSAPAEQRAPRWLPYALTAVAALCSGAILVALIPQPGAAAALSAETLASLPALRSNQMRFDQAKIRAQVGETVALRLDNADSMPHSFDLDAFNVHVPMQNGKPGLALFKATKAGTYTFYCSIPGHREAGMVGTLIVEP